MSAASDDSIENIDFGGRFARQFFNNNWPNIEGDTHSTHILNPTTSTPVASSDHSICDSGYESFTHVHRKSSTSPTLNSSFQHGSIDINNNSLNCSSSQANSSSIVSSSSNNNTNNHHNTNLNATSSPSTSSGRSNNSTSSSNTTNLLAQQAAIVPLNDAASVVLTPTTIAINSPVKQTNATSAIIAANAAAVVATASQSNKSNASYSNTINSNHIKQQLNQHQQHQNQQQQHQTINNHANSQQSTTNNSTSSLIADEFAKLSAGIGLMKLIMTPDVVVRQQRSNSLFTTTPSVANTLSATNPWSSQDVYQRLNNVDKIERAATLHRSAASFSEPQYTWSGQLPSRSYKNPVFSCKVFLGGVPWDVTEQGLIETFGRFGPLRVQWPGKDVRQQSGQTKAGYVYLIYESERYVKALLQACTQDFGSGSHPEKYFYQLSSRRMRFKEVQVIPWVLADSNYIRNQSGRPEMHRTVFVGALHGMLTAEGLAKIMNDLFGGVAYVGIDSDKHKYPIGSGRVVFYNLRSYMKAVAAAFIEVKSPQFNKKIQVDPYMEPSQCSTCHIQNGPIFCRDCLRYFCKLCWNWHHSTAESISGRPHHPLMRKKRET